MNAKSLVSAALVTTIVASALLGSIGNVPLAAVEQFSFSASGDYGFDPESLPAIAANGGDFHLALGDLSYHQQESQWCSQVKVAYNNWVLVAGNHDAGSDGDIDLFTAACGYPLGSPLTGQYGQLYFFDYPLSAPLIRIIMASPDIFVDYTATSPGFSFVRDAIRTARALGIPWVAVGMHKPCIEATGDKGCEIGTAFWDMLLSEGADLVLQAHAHTYQRTHQVKCASPTTYTDTCVVDRDNQYAKGAGTVLVIQGIGGESIRSRGNGTEPDFGYFATIKGGDGCWPTSIICPSAVYGTVRYTVTATSLSATAFFSDGSQFDPWSITAPPPARALTVRIDVPAEGTVGAQLNFTAVVSGGTTPYSVSWDFGDNSTDTGSATTHAYSVPGTFTVTVTVLDADQTVVSNSTTVTIVSAVGGSGGGGSRILLR